MAENSVMDSTFRAGSLVQGAEQTFAGKTAVVFQDHRLSYGQVAEAANRLANGLRGLELVTGDRVAVLMRSL